MIDGDQKKKKRKSNKTPDDVSHDADADNNRQLTTATKQWKEQYDMNA